MYELHVMRQTALRATLHYGQGPLPWNCGSPCNSSKWPYHGKRRLNFVWSWGFKSNVKTKWRGSRLNAISLPSFSCGPFYTISYNKLKLVRLWNVMVFRFCVRPISLRCTEARSSRLWIIIYCLPYRTPCRIFIHSNFLGPFRPSSSQSLHIPPMSRFNFHWSLALKL